MYDFYTFIVDVAHGKIIPYNPQSFSLGVVKESGLVPLLLAPIWLLFPYLQVGVFVSAIHYAFMMRMAVSNAWPMM